MAQNHSANTDANLPFIAGLIGGGLCVGTGVILLYYSFGYEQGGMADHLGSVGYSGLDNINRLGAADFSVGLILLGALVMVGLNAVAWRRTGGY